MASGEFKLTCGLRAGASRQHPAQEVGHATGVPRHYLPIFAAARLTAASPTLPVLHSSCLASCWAKNEEWVSEDCC